MTMKTTFVKAKDMAEWACSSKERAITDGEASPLPSNPYYGGLKKGSDEKRLKIQPASSLIRGNKPINRGKKKKNTKRSSSNKTSLVCHCCEKRCHNIMHCWCAKACSLCGNKGHHVAS